MISRRSFSGLIAGSIAMPSVSWGQAVKAKTVYYASIGPELTLFDLDVEGAALIKRSAVTLPANIQYAWPHPSRRYFYVASSNGGPGVAGDKHYSNAFQVDAATGALRPHGNPAMLPSRPIHTSVDASGEYLLTAFNAPSNVTVHRLNADGTIGELVTQTGKLDTGIYAHQVRATPSNRSVTLVTRGNNAEAGKPEDPGAIKTFGFDKGRADQSRLDRARQRPRLRSAASRFPSDAAMGVRLDRAAEQALRLQARCRDRPRARADVHQGHAGRSGLEGAPGRWPDPRPPQRQVRLRHQPRLGGDGIRGQENLRRRREQRRGVRHQPGHRRADFIQNIDGKGIQLRTFGIDPGARMLVAASIQPLPLREGGTLTAGLTVFRIGGDGKLEFARKYDVDTGSHQQFWSGMVTLA